MHKFSLSESGFSQYYENDFVADLQEFFQNITEYNGRMIVENERCPHVLELFGNTEKSLYFSAAIAILITSSFQGNVELAKQLHIPDFKLYKDISSGCDKALSAYEFNFGKVGLGEEFKKTLEIAKKFFLKLAVTGLNEMLNNEVMLFTNEIDLQMQEKS